MRGLRKGCALFWVFAVGAACSYDFDQYLAPSEANAGGHAGATPPSGGNDAGGAHAPSGGIGAGGSAAGDGSSAANGEGGEAESSGGTTSGGAPPSEAGAPIEAGGTGGEGAVSAGGGSPPASGGGSPGGRGGTAGTAANSGAPGAGSGGDGGGFDCSEAAGTVFNGHCYFLIGDGFGDGLEWNDARTACADLIAGAHLVTITSEPEEQFVEATFFPATADRWIGLALADTTGNPSNSCRRTPALCPFEWVTSESLSYTKWGSYSPTDLEPNYSGSCVRIQFDSIDWADRDCDDNLPAICETADSSESSRWTFH
jgi:hypothetical protein